jgi:DNA-directed RNA polymerase specialized sigma24 family protein
VRRVVRVMIEDLEELYRARRPEFCRAAAAIAGDRGLGEDAVQEAFAKAVRKRRSYRGRGTLEAWVWQIVVNAARDARRRRTPTEAVDHTAATNGRGPSLPLELLTDRQREVLFLHYYADLDYATIAAALGISPGTVGATLSTARAALRRALTPEVTT